MSGADEQSDSGWTVDTLRAHLLALIEANDRRYEERFRAQEVGITKSEEDYMRRFESVNEFRGQLGDQARTLMPRQESEARHLATGERISGIEARLSEQIAGLTSRMDRGEGVSKGKDALWGYLLGAAGFIIAAVALVTRFKT